MAQSAKKVQAPQKPTTTIFTGISGLSAERIKSREGVTTADITAFVSQHAGGNINNVGVRLTDTVNSKDELPFPWEKKKTLYEENGTAKSGLRAKVVWQLINSSNGKDPLTLAQVDQFHKAIKARSFHALIDALNGGQSAKSVSWGKNFIELYVIPKK